MSVVATLRSSHRSALRGRCGTVRVSLPLGRCDENNYARDLLWVGIKKTLRRERFFQTKGNMSSVANAWPGQCAARAHPPERSD
jgi:hypothetical protein